MVRAAGAIILALIMLILSAIFLGNVAMQRWYCHSPWEAINPFAPTQCEPIEEIIEQQAELKQLACQHPYSIEVNDPCLK